MSKITLTDLVNLQNETTAVNAINNNNATIETAFDNTLSRDGTSPNTMSAVIDMNSNQIINLPAPSTVNSPARLIDVVSNPSIVIPGTGTSGHTVGYLDTNNTTSGNNIHSGTETFNNTVNITGSTSVVNLTATGTVSLTANSIDNTELAVMGVNTAKGSIAGGTPIDLTKTQLTTLVNPVTSALSGAAPASGGGTTNFLRADATWAAPSASAVTLIETLTPAAVASVPTTVAWTSTYSSYEIIFLNVIPATNNVTFEMQVHAGGAYQVATYVNTTIHLAGSSTVVVSLPTTYIGLTGTSAQSNATPGYSGRIIISNPSSATAVKTVAGTGAGNSGVASVLNLISGFWNNTTAVDGAQFLFSSGNITSGTIKIYGIT